MVICVYRMHRKVKAGKLALVPLSQKKFCFSRDGGILALINVALLLESYSRKESMFLHRCFEKISKCLKI